MIKWTSDMTRFQISAAIKKSLLGSKYSTAFKKDGACCRILFQYDSNEDICSSTRKSGILMLFPDQEKEDTIVVSTDVIRLPQEMDSDSIWEILVGMNAQDKRVGVRYEAPFLYHASTGINRALLVIKEFRAISEDNVLKLIPEVIEEVMSATLSFQTRFLAATNTPYTNK